LRYGDVRHSQRMNGCFLIGADSSLSWSRIGVVSNNWYVRLCGLGTVEKVISTIIANLRLQSTEIFTCTSSDGWEGLMFLHQHPRLSPCHYNLSINPHHHHQIPISRLCAFAPGTAALPSLTVRSAMSSGMLRAKCDAPFGTFGDRLASTCAIGRRGGWG
jgi:hypothetical protein